MPIGPISVEWVFLMDEALRLAADAGGTGEIPVGAVVARADGTVVGRGCNDRERSGDPMGHAEIVAMREAASRLGTWRLDDCLLCVTLEPCTMCAGAAVQARVGTIVFGAFDDKAGACGSVLDVVRGHHLPHEAEVVAGFRQQECAALLREFFQSRR